MCYIPCVTYGLWYTIRTFSFLCCTPVKCPLHKPIDTISKIIFVLWLKYAILQYKYISDGVL